MLKLFAIQTCVFMIVLIRTNTSLQSKAAQWTVFVNNWKWMTARAIQVTNSHGESFIKNKVDSAAFRAGSVNLGALIRIILGPCTKQWSISTAN